MERRADLENKLRLDHGVQTVTFETFLREHHALEVQVERHSDPENSSTYRHVFVDLGGDEGGNFRIGDPEIRYFKGSDSIMRAQLVGRNYFLVIHGSRIRLDGQVLPAIASLSMRKRETSSISRNRSRQGSLVVTVKELYGATLAMALGGAALAADRPATIYPTQALKLAAQEMHRRASLENDAREAHGMPEITFQEFLNERHGAPEIAMERNSTPENSCSFQRQYIDSALGMRSVTMRTRARILTESRTAR
jgi:hypothetical protein